MFLIWGQKWGRYRRHHYGLPLRIFLPKTRLFVVVRSVGYLRAPRVYGSIPSSAHA